MRTEKEVYAATAGQLCAFLQVHHDPTTNIDALRSDALALLEALQADGSITFTFDELDDKAKDRVREWLSPDNDWWRDTYVSCKEEYATKGVIIDDIFFSIPEGAVWKGSINVKDWLQQRVDTDPEGAAPTYVHDVAWLHAMDTDAVYLMYQRVKTTGARYHTSVMQEEDMLDEDNAAVYTLGPFAGAGVVELLVELAGGGTHSVHYKLFEELNARVEEIDKDIYKRIKQEYEYLMSNAYIAETCEANGYVFTFTGMQTEARTPAEDSSATGSQQSLAF